ncbi:hypothetical protein [Mycobacterium mantenii]|uniref:hypothetical protein n=1 Tax=Mycobacterium mantenii TaxID=560555 RepID=UPI001A958E80|nr:hypothetical protein [Mycobacterium mantenii]
MTLIPESDPELVAAVDARATSRHAHHEAGHAVAAVARGGKLIRVSLGHVDWSVPDESADIPGETEHSSAYADQPFVTFAGPWAEAMWTVEHEDEVDDLGEALEYVWMENSDGDTDKYESRIEMLCALAEMLGFGPVGRVWEGAWLDELDVLWPAVCEIAALLIDGKPVTHELVLATVDRCQRD